MVNILENLCKKLNIKISYTNNKILILSCNSENNQPSIRAHKIFRECNENVAFAIIDYYTKAENRRANAKIIKDYADKELNFQLCKIAPPSDEFYDEVVKTMSEVSKHNEKSVVIELSILSITKKDFYSNVYAVNPNEPLNVSKDGILEVNITVDPLNK